MYRYAVASYIERGVRESRSSRAWAPRGPLLQHLDIIRPKHNTNSKNKNTPKTKTTRLNNQQDQSTHRGI